MKLSQREIEQVQIQMKAEPMDGDHLALPHLKTYIGDHTFYTGSDGVFIWENAPAKDGEGPEDEDNRLIAFRVASWADAEKRTIALHKPQITETAINLSGDETAKKESTEDDANPFE